MKMDNELILIGDRVHDVIFGVGTIDRIIEAEDRFWVLVAGRSECYDSRGNGRFGVRTLFWQNPFIIAPHKSDAAWELMGKLIEAISIILRGKTDVK